MSTNNPKYKFHRTERRSELGDPQLIRYDKLSPSFAREMLVLKREVVVGTIGSAIGIILWLLPILSSRLDMEVSAWMLTAGHYAPAFTTFSAIFAVAARVALLEEYEEIGCAIQTYKALKK